MWLGIKRMGCSDPLICFGVRHEKATEGVAGKKGIVRHERVKTAINVSQRSCLYRSCNEPIPTGGPIPRFCCAVRPAFSKVAFGIWISLCARQY